MSIWKNPETKFFWIIAPLLILLVADIVYSSLLIAAINGIVILVAAIFFYLSITRSFKVGQDTLAERNELHSIVASMEDALVVYDSNFIITFINSAAEKLFGIPRNSLIGQPVTPQDAAKANLRRLVQTLFPTLAPSMVTRSKPAEYPQIVDISFDSPYLELRTLTSPIADEKGNLSGFMKIIRDRTREVSLAKSKNEFITVASHQLRTPTTNLEWTIETLNGASNLDEQTKTLLENALVSVHQLRTIVEDLLNISRIEEGRFGYVFEDVDLSAFLETAISNAIPAARRLGISIYFDKPAEVLPRVAVDAKKLSMVASNLLDNAIRYNTQSGTVTVRIEKDPDGPYLRVGFKDTGIGIPPEDVEKLFTKFFRAQNAAKSVAEGSGLGLYIARNIVQAHGGRMWAESELGRGSTFYFTIPTDPTLIPPKEVPLEA